MSEFNLKLVIETLKKDYGEKRYSKLHGTEYFAIPKSTRKDIIRHLVATAKDQGKGIEYFNQSATQGAIVEACFPEIATKNWDKDKRRGAAQVVLRELSEVVAEIWPAKYKTATAPEVAPEREEFNPAKHGRLGKELDRSIFKDAPKPNTTVDPEAAKLLGFDDE